MKKKYALVSLFFGLIVMLALVVQSAHSLYHLEKTVTEKHCHHKYAKNKTEISHSHNDFEHCFTCEFTFSTSLKSNFLSFNFKKIEVPVSYSFFYSKEIVNHFKGSLFALRAPPIAV